MRPGYIIASDYIQLGLDSSVFGFAYTDLAPTGLTQQDQTAPDWQPATGTVRYQGGAYGTGPLVIDMGIPSAILTLPGEKPSATFSGDLTVDLLNSGGAVGYGFRTDAQGAIAQTNLMDTDHCRRSSIRSPVTTPRTWLRRASSSSTPAAGCSPPSTTSTTRRPDTWALPSASRRRTGRIRLRGRGVHRGVLPQPQHPNRCQT